MHLFCNLDDLKLFLQDMDTYIQISYYGYDSIEHKTI